MAQVRLIKRHYDLFAWLQGELQHFLPHEIFISAWGDFSTWSLKLDVISQLPGVRTEQLRSHPIDNVLRATHNAWLEGGRRPVLVMGGAEILESLGTEPTSLRASLSEMRSILVHGVRDERSGHDSLYLALSRGSFTKGGSKGHFLHLVDSLVLQIDAAFRKVAAYPLLDEGVRAAVHVANGGDGRELSAREEEILGWLCEGKTNFEVATALQISPNTVKNHVQRIFKKIGVSNRTQAVSKYSHVLQALNRALR